MDRRWFTHLTNAPWSGRCTLATDTAFTLAACMTDSAVGLKRILRLEKQLVRTPLTRGLQAALRAALRVEVAASCASLDADQAAAARAKKSERDTG